MADTKIPKDKTGYVMVGIFVIIALVVAHGIWKGTHVKSVQMEEDVLYIKPKAKI
jgi:hypothetical protein